MQEDAYVPAVGDVVMLKSGGPIMTVCEIRGKECSVRWWDSTAGYISSSFTSESLKIVPAVPPHGGDERGAERLITFISLNPVNGALKFPEIRHNSSEALGHNIIAVYDGDLCRAGKCEFCASIRRRIISRIGL